MFEQLTSNDWILQAEALDYLSRYEVPDAAGPVKAILEDGRANPGMRGRALVALSRIETAHAVGLATTYSTNSIVELRAASAEICYELPADKAAPIIKVLLAEKTPLVKFKALAAHARHRGGEAWTAAEPLMADVPENCIEPAARALGWIGTEPALAKLIELFRQGKSTPAMLRGLRGVKNPALAPFYLEVAAVDKGTLPIADIWQGLESCGKDAVIAACRQALASGDNQRVTVVARLMSSFIMDPGLGEALKRAVAKAEDPAALTVGLAALSCVDAEGARDVFLAKLDHEDARTRTFAIRCLAQDKAVNLYDVLEKMLADPESAVRVEALRSLREAPAGDLPQERVIEYFEASLMSEDQKTRAVAMAAIGPHISMDNGEAALGVLKKMQHQYGAAGTEPLMHAIFRMVPEEKAAAVLETHGYVARWHVIGEFPCGWGSPDKNEADASTVFPPEKKVDLKETLAVKYNTKGDTRFGKAVAEETITWVEAVVGNVDGVLFMRKAGRAQLQTPHKYGTSYAYTEITAPEKQEVRLEFLLNKKAPGKVWLNGQVLPLSSEGEKEKGTLTYAGQVTLNAGVNRILVKVTSNDKSPAQWAPKIPTRGFSLRLTDPEGKPVEVSYE